MGSVCWDENCKNHFKIVGQNKFKKKKKQKNDVATNVAQRESSSIKWYASAFSNTRGPVDEGERIRFVKRAMAYC